MNLVVMKGNITKDIELKFAQGTGTGIAKFSIAVARMKKDDPADFFNCTAFGKTAELIAERFHKGSPILITGHLQTGSYDHKNGYKVYTTDVIVDRFEFIGKKEENVETDNYNNEISSDITPVDDGDIPF